MRILILGATGFIGRNMVNYFAPHHEVTAVDHIKPRYDIPNVKWLCADLRKPFDFAGYDVVIQAAATTSGSRDIVNTPAVHVTDNAIMNALIFRAAYEAKVKHVIFFSCTVMYGSGHNDESGLIDIHPRYFGVAHTKLYCEKMCEFYAGLRDTKFTVIRHSNVYGPHDKYDLERSHVFGATVAKVMGAGKQIQMMPEMCAYEVGQRQIEANTITIWGTGEEKRDLLYISDLCEFVASALAHQPTAFGLYNCGSGVAVSINDLVARVIAASGKELTVEHDLTAPTIPTSLSLDCSKAKRELGWEPKVMLDEGIGLTLGWYGGNSWLML